MDNIKEKIAKMLEIAKRGGTEAEADTAMRMASEMLLKHNLSMSDITDTEVEDEDVTSGGLDLDNRQIWQATVVHAISALNFCQAYRSCYAMNGKEFQRSVIVGKPVNIQVSRQVSEYLITLGKELAALEEGDRVYRNSFKAGYAERISARCSEQRRRATIELAPETNLPAVRELYALRKQENTDFLKAKGVRLHSGPGSRASCGNGYAAGQRAGNSVSLNSSAAGRIGR